MITCGSDTDSGVAVGLRKTYLISRSTANFSSAATKRENVVTESWSDRGPSRDENEDENVLRARSCSWAKRTRTERAGGR